MDKNLKKQAIHLLTKKIEFKDMSYPEQMVEEHYKEWEPRQNRSFDFLTDFDLHYYNKDAIKERAYEIHRERQWQCI